MDSKKSKFEPLDIEAEQNEWTHKIKTQQNGVMTDVSYRHLEGWVDIYMYVLGGRESDVVASDWWRQLAPPIRRHYVTSTTL